jgi:hypothetical protein
VLTVVEATPDGNVMRGIFTGEGRDTSEQALALSSEVNIVTVQRPLER